MSNISITRMHSAPSYERASDEDKEAVKNLPNFDAAIFEEISEIHIETGKPEVQS